jgi:hypothetical protein
MVSRRFQFMSLVDKEKSSKESLGFAVSLIGFCIFVLYTIIPEVQNYPLTLAATIGWRMIALFAYTIFSVLVIYIFAIGVTLSPLIETTYKIKILNIAPYLYESAFYLLTGAIPISGILYFSVLLIPSDIQIYVIPLLGAFLFFTVMQYLYKHHKDYMLPSLLSIAIGVFIASIATPVPSNIELTMDNIYNSESYSIPISVKVTGFNTNLSVSLYSENGSGLYFTEELPFDVNNPRTKVKGNYLYGFYLEDGVYNIYINTSGMESGIYGLTFKVGSEYEYETFHLLASQKNNTNCTIF